MLSLNKLSETRVSRTTFDLTYQVTVRNRSTTAYDNVTLSLATSSPAAQIIDGAVAVGTMLAGASVTSTDTVTLRVDRSQPFDITTLVWQIQGTLSTTSPSQQLAQLETSGSIPKLERGPTVAGNDANNNGVRDDVDDWIRSAYASGAPQAAATQLARGLQSSMQLSRPEVAAAKAISLQISNAVNCVFAKFPRGGTKDPGRVVDELESISTNTKPRLLAYLAYNKLLDGTASALPTGDTCE